MEILKFESGKNAPRRSPASQKNKTIRLAVAIGAVALVGVLSSTLAANISINSGSNVEFGQGVSGAAACDGTLTITPTSIFSNTGGSTGVFYLGGITIADTSTTASAGLAQCAGKYLKIAAYDSSTSTPLTIGSNSGSGVTSIEIYIGTSASGNYLGTTILATAGSTGSSPANYRPGPARPIVSLDTSSSSAGTITVNLGTGTGVATSGQIYKITVESHS